MIDSPSTTQAARSARIALTLAAALLITGHPATVGAGPLTSPDAQGTTLDEEMITGTVVWTARPQPGWVPYIGEVGDFAADNTGVYYGSTIVGSAFVEGPTFTFDREPFTWSIEGDTLVVLFDDFTEEFFVFLDPVTVVQTYGFDQAVGDFLQLAVDEGRWDPFAQQEEVSFVITEQRSRELPDPVAGTLVEREERAFYSIDELLTRLEWPGELPQGPVVSTAERLLVDADQVRPRPALVPRPGQSIALPLVLSPQDPRVPQMVTGFGQDLHTLQADGTTSPGLLSGVAYNWRPTANRGLRLSAPGVNYLYKPLASVGDTEFWLVTIVRNGEPLVRQAQWAARVGQGGASLANDLPQELPTYWQAGLTLSDADQWLEDGRIEFASIFGYPFRGDGISTRVFTSPYPDCLGLNGDPCYFLDIDWFWSATGTRIVRTQDNGSFLRERQWEVLRYTPGGRAVVLEFAVADFSGTGLPEWFIFPRLNTLQLYSLDEWPDAWQDALDEGLEF